MGAADVTVTVDGAMTVTFEQIDDGNVRISYSGPELEARSVRIGYGRYEVDEDFPRDVREWLAGGQKDDLRYCVDAEITLAQARM